MFPMNILGMNNNSNALCQEYNSTQIFKFNMTVGIVK